MNVGEVYTAIWPDGLKISGRYDRTERGYVILRDRSGQEIPCVHNSVKFEEGDTCPPVRKDDKLMLYVMMTIMFLCGVLIGTYWD